MTRRRRQPKPYARHVLNAWRRATDAERADGARWYADAHGMVSSIAQARGLSTEAVAGVVAALSPQLSWSVNIGAARVLLDGGRPRNAYGANVAKAQRILQGERPEHVLGGNKVRSFYRLLRDAGNHWDVCVDGHAWHVSIGKLGFSTHAPGLTYAVYTRAAGAYRAAARRLEVAPHVVQAACWLQHRRRLDAYDARHRHMRTNGNGG